MFAVDFPDKGVILHHFPTNLPSNIDEVVKVSRSVVFPSKSYFNEPDEKLPFPIGFHLVFYD